MQSTKKFFNTDELLFALTALIAAAANYLVYPIAARHLNVPQVGDVTTVLSIYTQTLGALTALNILSIYFVKKYDENRAKKLIEFSQKSLIGFIIACSVVTLFLSPLLNHTLRLSNPLLLPIVGILLIGMIPIYAWVGYLQGHRRLFYAGAINMSVSILQLVAIVLLVGHWQVLGVLWGTLAGQVIVLVYFLIVPSSLPTLKGIISRASIKPGRSTVVFIAEAIISMAIFSFLQSTDMFFIKADTSTSVSGSYAGIFLVIRAIFFFQVLFMWIFVSRLDTKLDNFKTVFYQGAAFFVGVSAATGAILLWLGPWVIRVFLGSQYLASRSALLLALFYKTLVLLITYYGVCRLALGHRRGYVLALAIGAVTGITYLLHARTIMEILKLLVISSIGGVLVYFILMYAFNKRRPHETD